MRQPMAQPTRAGYDGLMRFIVYGAGAIGGVIGGRLFEHGHDVVLIARGNHYNAITENGLVLESASGTVTLKIPVVDHPRHIAFDADDVVLLAVKSHQTRDALEVLAAVAPESVPICCAQNGVDNERQAIRLFPNVYAVSVACPTVHLLPGVVQAYSAPTTGILDVGRYPAGADDLAEAIAAALSASTFSSVAQPDMARWKWGKLLTNLGNAIEAVCGPPARKGPIGDRAYDEGVACLGAAGVDFASEGDDRARRGDLLQLQLLGGHARPGGSSWQSLARSTGNIETDYLNGEIVLLGRLHSVPTPVNELLQHLANEMARTGAPPGSLPREDFLARVDARAGHHRSPNQPHVPTIRGRHPRE
jgi:2-dehydropantoate 2-reductase